MSVDDCVLIELPTISDSRGALTVVDRGGPVPFDVQRVFWVYDVQAGEERGAHAHHTLQEFVVCLHGAMEVHLDDGTTRRTVRLARPSIGLYIAPRIWRVLGGFSEATAYMVLASGPYEAGDYIRDYAAYQELVRA